MSRGGGDEAGPAWPLEGGPQPVGVDADEALFDLLGQRVALPGVTVAQVLAAGVRALAGQAVAILDVDDVAERIALALRERHPFSLIRFGDGESLTLAQGLVLGPAEVLARGPFLPAGGVPIPAPQVRDGLLQGIRRADLVGIPLSRSRDYQPLFASALAAAGEALPVGRLTHSLVNYELWKHGRLAPLLAGRRVLVVGGQGQRFAEFLAAHGVTVAGVVAPFRGVTDLGPALEACAQHRFDLALVSAGVAACLLCPELSARLGVVALDFGAMADEALREGLWVPGPPSGGPLDAAAVAGVCAAAGWRVGPEFRFTAQLLQVAGPAAVHRYTLWWWQDGSVRRAAFVAKTGGEGGQLAREEDALRAVRTCSPFAVPAVHLRDARLLALTDLPGTPLGAHPRVLWEEAAFGLAALHARARRLGPDLAADRPWSWEAHTARAGAVVAEALAGAAALGPGRRPLARLLERAWSEGLRAGAPLGERTTLVHGDFRAANVLVPPRAGPLAVVDWEDAAEAPPVWDVAVLARTLPPADRDAVLAAYGEGRAAVGWPLDRAEAVHDFTVYARLGLAESLAYLLAAEERLGEPAGEGAAVAVQVTAALGRLQAYPPR